MPEIFVYSFKPIIREMEFKSLTNIESSFRRIRMMAAVFICCCTLVTGYALWSSYRFAERQREKIYVPCNWRTRAPTTIMWILPRRDITTA